MISVLLATADRPDMAAACVTNLWATVDGHDVEIIAAVDGPAEDAQVLRELGCVVDHSREYRGCSQAWNAALSHATGEYLVLAADDLEWQPGWLDAALDAMAGLSDGWGLVGFNDGHTGPDFATHYLMSRRLVVEVFGGVVAWPFYQHSFNDVEASERAKRAGRYTWCETARVTHRHWLWGTRPQDQTDTRSLPGHPESQRMFEQRAAAGFPNDFEPVITC